MGSRAPSLSRCQLPNKDLSAEGTARCAWFTQRTAHNWGSLSVPDGRAKGGAGSARSFPLGVGKGRWRGGGDLRPVVLLGGRWPGEVRNGWSIKRESSSFLEEPSCKGGMTDDPASRRAWRAGGMVRQEGAGAALASTDSLPKGPGAGNCLQVSPGGSRDLLPGDSGCWGRPQAP